MWITRVGRASSTQSKRSSSIPVACFEYTLKFAPSRERVAPRGELRPSLVSCATAAVRSNRLLKKSDSCFDRLSTNGKSPTTSSLPPFALSLSKGERRVFQHPVRCSFSVVFFLYHR